jgi:hypothetical protein
MRNTQCDLLLHRRASLSARDSLFDAIARKLQKPGTFSNVPGSF